MPESLTLTTADGVTLEAELAEPDGPARRRVVLCHPHPQFGGSMRSIVISALFESLPAAGARCLRFNFRGVEGSAGAWGEGELERHDVAAAIDALGDTDSHTPLVVVGWSFGGDLTLSARDPRLDAWVAIAPPLAYIHDVDGLARDPRPKLVIVAEHDEFRRPEEVIAIAATWANTETDTVPGASHYFIGRTDHLVALVGSWLEQLTPAVR